MILDTVLSLNLVICILHFFFRLLLHLRLHRIRLRNRWLHIMEQRLFRLFRRFRLRHHGPRYFAFFFWFRLFLFRRAAFRIYRAAFRLYRYNFLFSRKRFSIHLLPGGCHIFSRHDADQQILHILPGVGFLFPTPDSHQLNVFIRTFIGCHQAAHSRNSDHVHLAFARTEHL